VDTVVEHLTGTNYNIQKSIRLLLNRRRQCKHLLATWMRSFDVIIQSISQHWHTHSLEERPMTVF